MRILAISGSLQPDSSNNAVLRTACEQIGHRGSATAFEYLREIPPFDASIPDEHTPESVTLLRRGIAESDGVLIATPEYAHSLPGVLKNALDWLVGSGEIARKPVAIITVSPTPTGGLRAQIALIQTLLAHSAEIVALLPIAASKLKIDAAGNVVHAPTARRIAEIANALLEHCDESAAH